ncbi:hypothetical protein SAMN05216598_1144 [Pseudomonas asplenii]|uniref:Uncharacterized protein n=1 Tax=Pseudomonas asplenii TaxID=53407 RepID=A0A1H1R2M1_9PSED|nr:hypothetical protein SAMN05216598_1144 [Pseudomonas asplenii]
MFPKWHLLITLPTRLYSYFTGSKRNHLRIKPEDSGETEVGYFAFFHSRYQEKRWPIALEWLRKAKLADEVPGQLINPKAAFR